MTTDKTNILQLPSTTLIITYLMCLATSFVLFQIGTIPYPYTKAPFGFILSTGTAFIACLPWILKGPKSKISSNDWFFLVFFSLFLLWIQKLIPLNIEEFHITTTVSRVSLVVGHFINIAFFVSIRILKLRQNKQ
jgi:hypothetical protein